MNSQNDTYFLREFVASHKKLFDKSNEKFIYSLSNLACICTHMAYLLMFQILHVKELVIFNIFSVFFYFVLLILVRLGKSSAALLYLGDIEIIAHAAFATHLLGWQPDFSMFFILIIPATFLTYTRKIYVPFIISAVSLGLFLYYKITMDYNADVKYVFDDNDVIKAIQITNAVIGVFVMLIAGVSNIFIREYKEFQLVDQRETFKEQASKDPLTHLFNRRAMNENIRSIRRDCSPRSQYIIGIGDIDNFKRINDTYGHDVGDCVIVQLGNYLNSKVKGDEILGRFGGDEFILVVKSTDDERAAVKLADEIVRGASENINIGKTDEKVSLSIGIAIYRGQEKNYSELFKKADIALYEAKADPDNRFYIYE